MRYAWLCGCVMGVAPMASADPLTFAEALGRAGAEAPSVLARRAETEAATLLIKPAGELPDPQLARHFVERQALGAGRHAPRQIDDHRRLVVPQETSPQRYVRT